MDRAAMQQRFSLGFHFATTRHQITRLKIRSYMAAEHLQVEMCRESSLGFESERLLADRCDAQPPCVSEIDVHSSESPWSNRTSLLNTQAAHSMERRSG